MSGLKSIEYKDHAERRPEIRPSKIGQYHPNYIGCFPERETAILLLDSRIDLFAAIEKQIRPENRFFL